MLIGIVQLQSDVYIFQYFFSFTLIFSYFHSLITLGKTPALLLVNVFLCHIKCNPGTVFFSSLIHPTACFVYGSGPLVRTAGNSKSPFSIRIEQSVIIFQSIVYSYRMQLHDYFQMRLLTNEFLAKSYSTSVLQFLCRLQKTVCHFVFIVYKSRINIDTDFSWQ